MLVIADASPLHYLILLESIDILPVLFDRIVMPQAVAAELQHPQTPAVVRVWMAPLPLGCTFKMSAQPRMLACRTSTEGGKK